ncbi:MAG: Zn-ribbon domain-containing OB-fold protein [Dehalococcoidia bacterium]|nr:Zn-ribbon domain-containing OB-fold protein [Dehalococcoidia bacterium]MSQ16283.1 Zn-ribbon domain-containing OB-fold protein [Dehalococcoidia bacterium]
MKPFSGTSLTDHALTTGEVLLTYWKVKAEYQWDAGLAMSTYLNGLKQGKLLGIHCPQCRRTLIPPRVFCELCFRPLDQWVELANIGKINTYSVSYVNWDATRRQTPEVPAVIEIDGASPGMGILHLMGEVGDTLEAITRRLKVGTPVQAVWKPDSEREGAITDIRYFRPIG